MVHKKRVRVNDSDELAHVMRRVNDDASGVAAKNLIKMLFSSEQK